MASSSSSSSTPWKYDVFFSFRGRDTRTIFIDRMYAAFRGKGMQVIFKDDLELERGRPISDVLTAIEKSRFFLIVFSKNYASSSWRLEELVKIFECCCKEGPGRQTAFPIFYGIDPSEVQEQTGRYREAFLRHETVFGNEIDQVHRWRVAMTKLANLSGWVLQSGGVVDLIQEVVDHIHSELRKSDPFSSIDAGDYIGMDSRLEILSPYLNAVEESNDVRFVGICGVGGVGKSTLARFVYSKMSSQFDGSSFLENIRVAQGKEGCLAGLQGQLLIQVLGIDNIQICSDHKGINEIRMRLGSRKVLMVLDDVNHLNQLKSLAGASNWFGSGSRIIITTRDESLLKSHGVKNIYRMGELGEDEACKLFCWRAFRDYTPAEGYEELSIEFVHYASGLPIALIALGSYMHGKSISQWKSALGKMKKFPDRKILKSLQISFDSLDAITKNVFLDIACFFVGEDVNFLTTVCGSLGITDLIDKSLIYISEGKVYMHKLVQQLGQEIVKEEHKEPGCRSRIWRYEDVCHILSNDTGSEQLEGIVLNVNPQEAHRAMSSKSFLKMKRLRLLRLPNLHCLQGQEYLSNELRFLEGNGYPFESLPSNFHPDKLVKLHLSHSDIKQLWTEKQRPLQMLKVIDLSYSLNLIKTPDFNEVPNLEELILKGCTKLREVHQSIEVLERLVLLNLKDCKSLKKLPSTIYVLKSLKNLILHGCPAVNKLPESLGDLTCTEVLDLDRDVADEQPPKRPWQILPWKGSISIISTLANMGREILHQGSPQGPCIWSREKHHVLEENTVGNSSTTPTVSDELQKLNPVSVDAQPIIELHVGKEIAKGSHGTVVLEGTFGRRSVAVKKMVKTHLDVASKEIESLIRLGDHPNIVRYLTVAENKEFIFIVLERCTCNLGDWIKNKIGEHNRNMELRKANGYPSPHLLQLMRGIVNGLAHLHDYGIVHWDLKPQNVLINKKPFGAKIADMGISKLLRDDMSYLSHASGSGTSGYKAPERICNEQRQTRAVDIFSLGCVLYFCITGGKHPFGEWYQRDANIVDNKKDLSLVEHIPEAVDLFPRLLDPNPDNRPKAQEVSNHPLFWASEKIVSFLREASDCFEGKRKKNEPELLDALEREASVALDGNWNEKMHVEFIDYINRHRRHGNYKYDKVGDLVRVFRNQSHHYQEQPGDIQKLFGSHPEGYVNYFSSRFPKLLIEVYKVVCKHCKEEEWFRECTKRQVIVV